MRVAVWWERETIMFLYERVCGCKQYEALLHFQIPSPDKKISFGRFCKTLDYII